MATETRNRLAGSSSPYLLQHAHNPVAWWGWCDEAFEEAQRRDVPVLLSIGYSTCYWCHVMERESFEHEPTAALMNEHLVSIKLDREEHPELDEIYMAATVTLTGRGGWPMTVFLDPHTRRPFWAGTYFPCEPRHGLPSFSQVIEGMSDAWKNKRDEIVGQAQELTDAVAEQVAAVEEPLPVGRAQIVEAVQTLLRMHDRTHGGFGSAPKFPQPSLPLLLLELRGIIDEQTKQAIDAALRLTLDKMDCGGIHDQVGGGFHRYAVDGTWTVPHFEKMLYDQSQLLTLFARSSVEYDDAGYARVARRIGRYVLREMTGAHGGFLSAQDAEVDGREGQNFLWTEDEARAELDAETAAAAIAFYRLDRGPNFQDPHHPDEPARTVLRLDEPIGDQADALDAVNAKMLEARSTRKQPGTDDKCLASWNGMMITALAEASALLDEPEFAGAALAASRFVREHLVRDGVVLRSWRDGITSGEGTLEDAAAVASAFAAAHRLDPDAGWLAQAQAVFGSLMQRFASEQGVLFDAEDRDDLFVRPRSLHDGAVPSGQSLTLHALLDLAAHDPAAVEGALAHLDTLSSAIAASPVGAANSTRGLVRMLRTGMVEFGEGFQKPDPSKRMLPAEVFTSEERLTVSKGTPGEMHLAIKIKDGYHILAADHGVETDALIGLRVGLIPGSGTGVTVYANYPEGEPLDVEGEAARVYTGEVTFQVVVERNDQEWQGRPILGVTYQPCTETACEAPVTVELEIPIDLSGS